MWMVNEWLMLAMPPFDLPSPRRASWTRAANQAPHAC